MGLYSVVLKPSVEKDFRQLPKNVLTRVIRLIEGLAANLTRDPFIRCVPLFGSASFHLDSTGRPHGVQNQPSGV